MTNTTAPTIRVGSMSPRVDATRRRRGGCRALEGASWALEREDGAEAPRREDGAETPRREGRAKALRREDGAEAPSVCKCRASVSRLGKLGREGRSEGRGGRLGRARRGRRPSGGLAAW
ncbi:hypothetical protein BDY21DRAFT_331307 [Lineolata rhizophorae]|uniref:Uncharacterized protein n=1 Tax=Lineolata rhizophorae TaxID=578093 RepID=A0A6A6PEK5_9PEZI|nr:hypothetical protein BDY21DRAFT_331307 [Lineolata rhizophorae]